MPSSPLLVNYSSSNSVTHCEQLPMTSRQSKRSELFSILDDNSELRRLCDDDEATSIATSSLLKLSAGEGFRSPVERSQGSRPRSRGTPKRIYRKKHTASDLIPTSIDYSAPTSSELEDDRPTHPASCRKASMHYCHHPYNVNSLYEGTSRLKHKKCSLRSTAPVLYDLLSDECDTQNHDSSNSIPYTSALANELCRSADLYLNPLSLPLPLMGTSPLNLLPSPDQRPMVSYFNNLMQQSLLINTSPMNLLKIAQPSDAEWLSPAAALVQPSLNAQLYQQLRNLSSEPETLDAM